ncbi:hypothetical protein CC78DRAFT_565078 [Lojkania enalia]|uniref:Uncharacterized protein n=1 Tax=Lojkania enalia TaxID=147567 RepID=A0A9P4KHQ3_9PLEO|nr:hypothetical protein CC78DRAFT_565078 [Didymosphaeria enalia]
MNIFLHERYQASLNGSRTSRLSLYRSLPPLPTDLDPSNSPRPNNSNKHSGAVLKKHPSVPVWSDNPQTSHRRGWFSVLSCTGDVIVILTSTVFFVFGTFVLYFDGAPVSEVPHIYTLKDAARYGPTVFPILFAAIVGQTMHAIAHWRLENGERMKILDQLLGSTGLFSTIITQLKFRNVGFVGAALITLWILSPIGGQASLRILDFSSITYSRPRILFSMDRNATYQPSEEILLGVDEGMSRYISSSLFVSAMASTKDVQQSGMDSWGNLKIPMLERLPFIPDSDGWTTIDRSLNVTYSSLIGVPVSNISADRSTTFSLESWYWTFDCPILFRPTFSDPRKDFLIPGENITKEDRLSEGWKVSISSAWALSTPYSRRVIYESDSNITRRPFYYRGYDDEDAGSSAATRADCYMSTSFVEVAASCAGKNCTVTRMRPSTRPHPPAEHAMGIDPWGSNFIVDFFDASGPNMFQKPTPLQRFFASPYTPFTNTGKALALYKLPKVEFATSLAQLMNTFWQAATSMGQITSGIPPLQPDDVVRNTSGIGTVYFKINATEFETHLTVKCQRAWLAALYIATSAMFLSGIFGLALQRTRKAPNFALNISSLARDNPYITLPPGGSILDSIDRSRLLQDVRIRLGNVKPDDPVGYIAIASCDEMGRVVRLRGVEGTGKFE